MTTQGTPTYIAKGFDQVAFAVRNLDEATKLYSEILGVENWSVWSDLAINQIDKTYRGEPEDFQFSAAYGYAGDVLIELCQHDGGRTVYKEWLDTRNGGINHVGSRVANAGEFEQAARQYAELGIEAAMGGELVGVGRYIYFDTVDQIGCFTEIYHISPEIAEVFERMKRGEIVEGPS